MYSYFLFVCDVMRLLVTEPGLINFGTPWEFKSVGRQLNEFLLFISYVKQKRSRTFFTRSQM